MKKITILGSTGSIGTQTLDVIRQNPERFSVSVLTCGSRVDDLIRQIREFRPEMAVCAEESGAQRVRSEFPDMEVSWGEEGLIEAARHDCDILLNSLMGMRGLVPTYTAIGCGHDIALANKETLVSGGSVIMDAVKKHGVRLLPVDSEHSAIFQCLEGNRDKKIKKILLTASGGPFRGFTAEQLEGITPEMALRHPNWSMGKKITIDSATLMNKGLEMIEARWLFDLPMEDIEVLVHPQSIVHSGVEFMDTSVLMQLGVPDMRIPISVALGYPERLELSSPGLDFFGAASELSFEKPDRERFRCLPLAEEAARMGGVAPCVMNAANEVLVEGFLEGRVGFQDIPEEIERILLACRPGENPDLGDIVEADRETRIRVRERIDCGL